MPWDAQGEAQAALRIIVADPRYGPTALSNAQTMTNLLKDMLPDAPRESSVLVAASDVDVPGILQNHVSQGMDLGTASRLAAGSFESRTALTPDACTWAVGAMASALGLDVVAPRPAPAPEPTQETIRAMAPGPAPGPGPWPGPAVSPSRPNGRHAATPERAEIPTMPKIGPSEQVADVPYPLLDGLSPTIGWQFRPQDKGGQAFMLIRRSALGYCKVVETFPLTEDGWASAWQSLARQNPAAVPKVLAALRARDARRSARAADVAAGIQRGAPAKSASPVEELTKLADMLEKGLLTREEFDLMKAKLLGLHP